MNKLVFSHEVRGKLLEVTAECHRSVLHAVCKLQHTGDDVVDGGDLLSDTIKLDTSRITHKILRVKTQVRWKAYITRGDLGACSPCPSSLVVTTTASITLAANTASAKQ